MEARVGVRVRVEGVGACVLLGTDRCVRICPRVGLKL
jgi:hypothetical protein